MKFLRALYMIMASIALLPVIVIIEFVWLLFLAYSCAKESRTNDALKVWFKYLQRGIEMNLDFIENGL